MRAMNLIGMMLLMILCNSCSFPSVEVLERCTISIEYNKCRCIDYEITQSRVGPIGEGRDMPLEYCDNLVGFPLEDYSKLIVWINEVYIWIGQQSGNKWVKRKLKKTSKQF